MRLSLSLDREVFNVREIGLGVSRRAQLVVMWKYRDSIACNRMHHTMGEFVALESRF